MEANELETSLRASMLKSGDTRLNPSRPLTNGGKIRNMTDAELAEFLMSTSDHPDFYFKDSGSIFCPYSIDACLEWLKSESV